MMVRTMTVVLIRRVGLRLSTLTLVCGCGLGGEWAGGCEAEGAADSVCGC